MITKQLGHELRNAAPIVAGVSLGIVPDRDVVVTDIESLVR
jgi:hypothetical protein